MNKIFIITFVLFGFLFTGSVSAGNDQQGRQQGRKFDRKAFIERRNAFLISEIGLTSSEAATFIPLYDEYQSKKFEIGQQCRKLSREIRKNDNATPADYTEVVDECVGVKSKEAKLDLEYFGKFKTVLSPEKLYKLTNAEYKFAREFMRNQGNRK